MPIKKSENQQSHLHLRSILSYAAVDTLALS